MLRQRGCEFLVIRENSGIQFKALGASVPALSYSRPVLHLPYHVDFHVLDLIVIKKVTVLVSGEPRPPSNPWRRGF